MYYIVIRKLPKNRIEEQIMNDMIARNLKRFRISKKLTQEQAAELLGVNSQTISRWECSTSLPDITLLPEIAKLYGVTIDDLYRETSVAYENYAQRLAAKYESNRDPQDFLMAEQEFTRLISKGNYSADDLRTFGITYQYMMMYCQEKALYWLDRAIAAAKDTDPNMLRRSRAQKLRMLALLSRSEEALMKQQKLAELHPEDVEEQILLLVALMYAEKYEDAYQFVGRCMARFPEEWEFYVHASDISRKLERYDEALRYADRAISIHPTWVDAKYAKAWCFENMQKYQEAYEMYLEIAADCRRDGYEIEADAEMHRAKQVMEQYLSNQ
jgi:transcriptional regulator with XRE-family HTH domain